MAESKSLIKEFERVSQEDPSVDPEHTAQRKREMVKQLNDFVQRKKAAQADIAARQEQLEAAAGASPAPGAKPGDLKPDPFAAARDAAEREKQNPFSSSGAASTSSGSLPPMGPGADVGGAGGGSKFSKFSKGSGGGAAAAAAQSEIVAPGERLQGMQTEELLVYGRDKIKDTDAIIDRSKATVARTIELGTQTAEQLRNQTQQMEKVVDDLDEIHFSLKKSMKVIKDLTRGLATDKCILTLLFIVVMGVVAIIAVKMAGLDKDDEVAKVRRLYSRRLLLEPEDVFHRETAHEPWRGTTHRHRY